MDRDVPFNPAAHSRLLSFLKIGECLGFHDHGLLRFRPNRPIEWTRGRSFVLAQVGLLRSSSPCHRSAPLSMDLSSFSQVDTEEAITESARFIRRESRHDPLLSPLF